MSVRILTGDCRELLATLDAESVQTCVTSPPYFGLRDYGVAGQIGLESTPDAFVAEMVSVFAAVRRVLRDDGTLWLNLGDSYAAQGGAQVQGTKQTKGSQAGAWGGEVRRPPCGFKPKDLLGIPWRVAFALQADGWYLRSDIIWAKPNAMPESVSDRPTKAHEYLFLLTKSQRYYYDAEAIKEPAEHGARGSRFDTGKTATHQLNRTSHAPRVENETRNRRSVWSVPTQPYRGAHFATFPPALIEPCILAGSKRRDTVLDPFGGAGTTGLVAHRLGRDAILTELNPDYAALARTRIHSDNPLFGDVA